MNYPARNLLRALGTSGKNVGEITAHQVLKNDAWRLHEVGLPDFEAYENHPAASSGELACALTFFSRFRRGLENPQCSGPIFLTVA